MRQRRLPWIPAAAAGACLAMLVPFMMDDAAPLAASLDTDDRDAAPTSGPLLDASAEEAAWGDRVSAPPLRPGHAATWDARFTAAAEDQGRVRRMRGRDPGALPWTEESVAPEDEVPSLVEELSGRRGYASFLRDVYRLPDAVAGLRAALDGATDPIARQMLIFHTAMALPLPEAGTFLAGIRAAGDEGDRLDALGAGAFRGVPGWDDEFVLLATSPSPADVRRDIWGPSVHDALVAAGERDVLRSYRCIEMLDTAPYFHMHGLGFHAVRDGFPWASRDRGDPAARALRLLPAWMDRWPGHCGSDDMAFRLSTLHLDEDRPLEALRWASRAATEPDQDMSSAAVARVIALVEFAPEGSPLLYAVPDPAAPDRNAELLAYIRLRRVAADRGFAAAVDEAPWRVAALPGSCLERAWAERWAVPPTAAVAGGDDPLPADDPLRRVVGDPLAPDPLVNPSCAYASWSAPPDGVEDAWLHPTRERVRLPVRLMARQFRAWSTLAALERREALARTEDERASLLYRQGAVFHHEPRVLYPAYARRAEWRSGLPEPWAAGGQDVAPVARDWMRRTFSRERAADLFHRVAAEHASWQHADRSLYSEALNHMQSLDDPATRWWAWDREWLREDERRRAHAGVEAFERLATWFPASPLRRNAAAAASWWRRHRPRLLLPY